MLIIIKVNYFCFERKKSHQLLMFRKILYFCAAFQEDVLWRGIAPVSNKNAGLQKGRYFPVHIQSNASLS